MAPDPLSTVILLPGLDRPPVWLVMIVCAVLLPALDSGPPPDARDRGLWLVPLVASALFRGPAGRRADPGRFFPERQVN